MKKVVILQSPAFLYEVVPPFYRELNKLQYFDTFYLATDHAKPYGLGDNVRVVQLERDLGWEGNLTRLLGTVPEELFVMMCDDHVTVEQTAMDLDPYFEIMANNPQLGRLQLSPPSHNYARFLRAHRLPVIIPDDSEAWYQYNKQYRWHLNFQPSIWRKDFLRDVIKGGGNKSQLEVRASERARLNQGYVSGYIGRYAVHYENFFASCQVHHTDPQFHKREKTAHYREEFLRYAMQRGIELDSGKRVYVRRQEYAATVPVDFYIKHFADQEKYREYVLKRNPLAHRFFRLGKGVRAAIAPYISQSSR